MVEKPQPNKIVINGEEKGFGYLRDLASLKDFSINTPKVSRLVQELKLKSVKSLPSCVDLRSKMTPIRDQKNLGSCTSFAMSGIVEYFEKDIYHRYTPVSTLFTYKATRNLMKVKGDTGAYMRSVMGSLALFGTPPEEFWEYDIKKFDIEPPAFTYAFASNFQSMKYIRLDHSNALPEHTMKLIKQFLVNGFPSIFGFTVFESIEKANSNGGFIPYPNANENVLGGHAMVICGYDDKTKNFIIRNSWGTDWGDSGYGYLPYAYFENSLADDVWIIISQEYVDHAPFQE